MKIILSNRRKQEKISFELDGMNHSTAVTIISTETVRGKIRQIDTIVDLSTLQSIVMTLKQGQENQ